MSIQVSVGAGDLKKLERDLRRLQQEVGKKAVVRVVNRAAASVRAVAAKEISAKTGFTQKEIREDVFVRKANTTVLSAIVDARAGRAKNLIRFVSAANRAPSAGPGHAQKFRARSKAKHRRYLKRGVAAKAYRTNKVYEGTFIIRGRNNNVIVVSRKGRGRGAGLKSIVGPSIRHTFIRPVVLSALRRQAKLRVPKEIEQAINFAKGKARLR